MPAFAAASICRTDGTTPLGKERMTPRRRDARALSRLARGSVSLRSQNAFHSERNPSRSIPSPAGKRSISKCKKPRSSAIQPARVLLPAPEGPKRNRIGKSSFFTRRLLISVKPEIYDPCRPSRPWPSCSAREYAYFAEDNEVQQVRVHFCGCNPNEVNSVNRTRSGGRFVELI